MTDRVEERHPHLLAWYVAGALKPAEAREVREHVDGCDECRRAADGLAAMVDALSSDADRAHVEAEDLVRYEAAGQEDDPGLGRVEAHLLRCAACREELALLRGLPSADGPLPLAEPSASRPSASGESITTWLRRRWRLAASLSTGVLVVVLIAELRDRQPPPAEVVFTPPRRADAAPPHLTMPGPWSLKVMLPFSAPREAYRARVETQQGSVVNAVAEPVAATPEGALSIPLPSIDRPGSYRLILAPLSSQTPADAALIYPFAVVAGSPSD